MIRLCALLKPAFWLACLAVTTLSLTPIEHLPPQIFNWWDKAQHAIAFFVLTGLGLGAYGLGSRLTVGAGLLALGIGIEIAQDWTGWRYGEIADACADVIGIVLALLAAKGCCVWRDRAQAQTRRK